jgi:uncharacterized protein (DUF1778 family)
MGITRKKTAGKPVTAKTKGEVVADTTRTVRSKPMAHARFDARLSQEQKALFEQAAAIKGFKSLTEFVIYYTSEAAIFIIEKHNQVLVSEKDKSIFFDALVNPPKPNAALLKAARNYKDKAAAE